MSRKLYKHFKPMREKASVFIFEDIMRLKIIKMAILFSIIFYIDTKDALSDESRWASAPIIIVNEVYHDYYTRSGFYYQIDDGKVAWVSHGNVTYGNVYLYDGNTTLQIANNGDPGAGGARIRQGQVVWVGRVSGKSQIFLYDGTNTNQISSALTNCGYPCIDYGKVVYANNPDIFFYETGITSQLTNSTYPKFYPKISGNYTLWEECHPEDYVPNGREHFKLFLYDGIQTKQLTDFYTYGKPESKLDNGKCAWRSESSYGKFQVEYYDGSDTKVLSDSGPNGYDASGPAINNGMVVWSSNHGDIFLYNGITTTKIASNGRDPKINNGKVVWSSTVNGKLQIFVYDGASTTQLTNDSYNNMYPMINRDEIVWCRIDGANDNGNDAYIMLGKLISKANNIFAVNLNSNNQADIIIDFGPQYGIWIYFDNGNWAQITSLSSKFMAAGKIDSDNLADIVFDFGSQYGIWVRYGNGTWSQITDMTSESMAVGDIDGDGLDDVIIDFGVQYGVWTMFAAGQWQNTSDVSPESMAIAHIDNDNLKDIVFDFGSQYGIWIRYGTGSWEQVTGMNPESIAVGDISGDGLDDLAIDFGSTYGIWIRYGNGSWTQVTNMNPESIKVGRIDSDTLGDLVIDFGSIYGIWVRYGAGNWQQITNIDPDTLTAGDIDGNDKDDLIIDFGPQYGIWIRRDDGSWMHLSTISP